MSKCYRFFKREWVNKGWNCPTVNEYINELKMEDFIDDVGQYSIRVQRIDWKHDTSPDVKGTAFEWVPKLEREVVMDRMKANELFKQVQRTKYTTQKVPTELRQYIK